MADERIGHQRVRTAYAAVSQNRTWRATVIDISADAFAAARIDASDAMIDDPLSPITVRALRFPATYDIDECLPLPAIGEVIMIEWVDGEWWLKWGLIGKDWCLGYA